MTLDIGPFISFHIFSHNQIIKEGDDVLISLPTGYYIYIPVLWITLFIWTNKGHLTRCWSAQLQTKTLDPCTSLVA